MKLPTLLTIKQPVVDTGDRLDLEVFYDYNALTQSRPGLRNFDLYQKGMRREEGRGADMATKAFASIFYLSANSRIIKICSKFRITNMLKSESSDII